MNSTRDLYHKIYRYNGDNLLEEILLRWVEENNYRDFLLAARSQLVNEEVFTREVSWELYALSRVLDVLTLRFQPDNHKDGSSWSGPRLNIHEYGAFVEKIGGTVMKPRPYHPFYHEITEAMENKDDFHVITVASPTILLENMILKKGGVIVGLNPGNYDISFVNNATLYWAYRRKNREFRDLSNGWGHNSQWRTAFRCDLETEDAFIYNFSGKYLLNLPGEDLKKELKTQGLKLEEAIELTKYRHFISAGKDDKDLFPYDFRYEEKKSLAKS